jgi:hypothetical protein
MHGGRATEGAIPIGALTGALGTTKDRVPGHVGRAAHWPATRSYHVTAAETKLARGSAPAIADALMARTAQLLRTVFHLLGKSHTPSWTQPPKIAVPSGAKKRPYSTEKTTEFEKRPAVVQERGKLKPSRGRRSTAQEQNAPGRPRAFKNRRNLGRRARSRDHFACEKEPPLVLLQKII